MSALISLSAASCFRALLETLLSVFGMLYQHNAWRQPELFDTMDSRMKLRSEMINYHSSKEKKNRPPNEMTGLK